MSTQRNVHTYTLSSFPLQNPKVKHIQPTLHISGFFLFFFFILFLKLYIIVLVLPNIKMNPPQWFLYLRIQPSADQKYFGKNLESFK